MTYSDAVNINEDKRAFYVYRTIPNYQYIGYAGIPETPKSRGRFMRLGNKGGRTPRD